MMWRQTRKSAISVLGNSEIIFVRVYAPTPSTYFPPESPPMNNLPKNSSPHHANAVFVSLLAVLSGLGHSAQAATKTWNNTNTAWATPADWDGGAPANNIDDDIALFNSATFSKQPNYGTTSVNGIQVGDGATVTGNLTFSGSSLTLGSSGIDIAANAGNVTVGNAVKIGANQTWSNHSDSLLAVTATITNSDALDPKTLTLGTSGSGGITLSGVISDGGGTATTALNVNSTGSGIVTLSSANTFSGGLTLTQGILRVTGKNADVMGTGALTLAGGELQLGLGKNSVVFSATSAVAVTGDTRITADYGTADSAGLMYRVGSTFSIGNQTLTVASGDNIVSGTAGVTFGATTLAGDNTTFSVINGDSNTTALTLGALSGTSSVTKIGDGTLTFSGSTTTFSGDVFIKEGTLAVTGGNALGTGAVYLGDASGDASANLTLGAMVAYGSNSVRVQSGSGARSITLTAPSTSNAHGLFGGLITLEKDLTINASSAGTNVDGTFAGGIDGVGNLTINNTGNPLFFTTTAINNAGTITNTGSTSITSISAEIGGNVTDIINDGPGTLVLGGSNSSFLGNVTVLSGTLRMGSSNALNASNTVYLKSGAVLDLKQTNTNSYDETIAGLNDVSGGGGGLVTNTGSGAKTLTLGGTGDYRFSGVISNGSKTISLVMSGPGTQTLSGANTYGGTTTVNGGTLALDFAAAGAPASNIINNGSNLSALILGGGNLVLNGASSAVNSQQFNGLSVAAGASNIALNNAESNSLLLTLGAITRNTGSTLNFDLPTGVQGGSNGVTTTSTTAVSNNILVNAASNGIAYATVGGNDWASLNGNNIVGLSTVAAYSTGAGNYLAANNMDVEDGDSVSGVTVNTLRFNSATDALTLGGVNTISTGGILVTSAATNASITGGTLQSGGGRELVIINNGNLNISSIIADNGGIASSLTYSGTGTGTLSGINTYTGATTINSGKLLIDGSLGNSTVIVRGGAALGGTGFIGGAVTLAGGKDLSSQGSIDLRDGAIGELTLGNGLNIGSGGDWSNLYFDLGSTAGVNDVITVDGLLTLSGSGVIHLNLLNASSLATGDYTLMTASGGGLGAGFTLAQDTMTINGITYAFSLENSQAEFEVLTISLASIPEPGTWALVLSGMGMLGGFQRLRKRQEVI